MRWSWDLVKTPLFQLQMLKFNFFFFFFWFVLLKLTYLCIYQINFFLTSMKYFTKSRHFQAYLFFLFFFFLSLRLSCCLPGSIFSNSITLPLKKASLVKILISFSFPMLNLLELISEYASNYIWLPKLSLSVRWGNYYAYIQSCSDG